MADINIFLNKNFAKKYCFTVTLSINEYIRYNIFIVTIQCNARGDFITCINSNMIRLQCLAHVYNGPRVSSIPNETVCKIHVSTQRCDSIRLEK